MPAATYAHRQVCGRRKVLNESKLLIGAHSQVTSSLPMLRRVIS